ncbi:hypothetical protein OROHE_022647 [Orobanche hederae]
MGSESDLLEEGLVHEQTELLDSFLDETRIPLYFLKRRVARFRGNFVFDMGPSNLKQKRTFVTRSALKDIFDKERALGGQHETTKKLGGIASPLPSRVNRPQTTEDHLTVDTANILPSLTTEQAFEPGYESSPVRSRRPFNMHQLKMLQQYAGSKKRSRGPTTGKGLRKYFDSFGKIKINVDPSIGRPVNAGQSAYQVILV